MSGQIVSGATPIPIRRAKGSTVNFANQNPVLATTAAAVAANVATLTMASNPLTFGFFIGQRVLIAGFSGADTYFNGFFVLTNVTATQISYALVHANAAAATNGTASGPGSIWFSGSRNDLASAVPGQELTGGVRLYPGTVLQYPDFSGVLWARGTADTQGLEVTP